MGQVVSLEEMMRIRQDLRERGQRLVLTNGCFDLLHRGHVIYLQSARAHGDALVVGLNSDASVRALKGEGRPLSTQNDRAIVLAALAAVDYVVLFDAATAQDLVRALQPDVYVKGGDYACAGATPEPAPAGKPLPEAQAVQAYGGTVVILAYLPGYSTSALIDTILARTLIPDSQAP